MFIVPADTPGREHHCATSPTMEHPARGVRQARRARGDPLRRRAHPGVEPTRRRGRGLPASPSSGSTPDASTTACAGSASPAARSTCCASAPRTAQAHGKVLGEHQTVQNWIADSAAEMQAARLMTLHAAWVMDTQGTSAARADISLIKFYGAGVLHDVIDRAAPGARRARLLDRPAARGDVPLLARMAPLRRARRGPPPVGGAPDPSRLLAARRRSANRTHTDQAGSRKGAFRGAPGPCHRQRLPRPSS